jgi:putative phosphoesterase
MTRKQNPSGKHNLINDKPMQKPYKIVLLADIHGLLPPLEAVLAEVQAHSPDEIIIAGDFLGGPQPVEVLARLQSADCQFILGNGEVNLLNMRRGTAPREWWTHRQFDMGRWIYNRLDEAVFDFLESLPEQRVISPEGCKPLRVVHGSPWDNNKLVFPDQNPQDLSCALAMIPEDVLVFAHNHLPGIFRREGKLALNPGSVSNNLNGDLRASYATLTWDDAGWQPDLHYVAYDPAAVVETFKATGFLTDNRPLARAFLESILTAENTPLAYILFAWDKAQAAGFDGFTAVPDEVWLASEAIFPWQYDF